MNNRLKLILTRPTGDSLESFVSFRQNTSIQSKKSKTDLKKDDLVNEWKKFWERMNSRPKQKVFTVSYIN